MSTVDYSLEVYSAVNSIAGELFGGEDGIEEQLEEEFGIDFYPLEDEPSNDFEKNTANEYLRAGFGISSLLAEEYVEPQDTFFGNRVQDFRDFEEELGDDGNQVLTDHLFQYVNLYGGIAEEEGVEVSYSTAPLALMEKSEKKGAVLQVLGELEEGLSGEMEQEEELA